MDFKKIFKKDAEFLIGLLFLTTLVYATSWFGEFISDDIPGIVQNPLLGNLTHQLKTHNLNNIINSFIYKTFGLSPFWFHLVNTAFHLATVILVYLLTSLLLKENIWLPRLSALFFALHPIETEGVTWISGLPYANYTFFFLLSLVFFITAVRKSAKEKLDYKNISFSTLFFIFSLSASEKAIILPVILFLFLLLFSRLNKKNLTLLSPTIIIALYYALSRLKHLESRARFVASPTGEEGVIIFNPLIQVPIAIYSYLKLLLFPFNLTLYHEFVAFPAWEYYLAIAVTLSLFSLLFFLFLTSFKKARVYRKISTFGLSLFLVSLSPTLLPINIAWVVAERYVHLGSLGIFLSLALLADSTFRQVSEIKRKLTKRKGAQTQLVNNKALYFRILIILLILFYTPLTIKRNLEWRSQDTLWPATVRESPLSAYAWNNMGDYYGRRGDIQNALRAFERARQLRPRYAEATHNLGNTYLQIGEATKAAQLFEEALNYNPRLYQAEQKLGIIALEQKNYQEAEKHFLASIKLNPNPFVDYLNLYIVYDYSGQKEKAQKTLLTARRLAGQNPQKIQLIQKLLLKLNQEKEKS